MTLCSLCNEDGHNKRKCLSNPNNPYTKALPLFGVMTDEDIAKRVGMSRTIVSAWRCAQGVKPVSPPRSPPCAPEDTLEAMHPGMRARLGRESDARLAGDYGLTRERIRQIRLKFGVPVHRPRSPPTPPVTAELKYNFRYYTDTELTHMYKMSVRRIKKIREELGVPLYKKEWTQEEIQQLGSAPDAVVAQRLGVGPNHVFRLRKSLQIPPHRTYTRRVVTGDGSEHNQG